MPSELQASRGKRPPRRSRRRLGPRGRAPSRSKPSDVVMFDERWRQKESRLRAASPYGNLRGWRTLCVYVCVCVGGGGGGGV